MPEALQKSSRTVPGEGSANRRRLACAALLALTIPVGLVWRLAPLGLPQFAFKYGGSALWAVAVYWVIAGLLPRWQPPALAVLAAVVAAAVEFFKLVRAPAVDVFRETLAGKLLIGRYFTFGAIVAYWLAIAAVTALDLSLRPGRRVT
jgi:hypothetical protein